MPDTPPPLILCGELDAANAPDLRDRLAGTGPVTVDLAAVTFVDSTILDVFARAATVRPVTIIGAQRPVRRVLEISGIDQIVTVEGP